MNRTTVIRKSTANAMSCRFVRKSLRRVWNPSCLCECKEGWRVLFVPLLVDLMTCWPMWVAIAGAIVVISFDRYGDSNFFPLEYEAET